MGNDRRTSSSSRREDRDYVSRDRRDDRTKDYDRKDKYRDIERDRYRTKDQDLERERYTRKEERHVSGRDRNDKESTRARENELKQKGESAAGSQLSTSQLKEVIQDMRKKRKSESCSEVLSWVHKSRKLEERKHSEKEKSVELDEGDDVPARHTTKDLAGIKVLHGLDKVAEGGAVVLTLKDQSILAGDDLNEENDMLENVEIGEQKRRDDAHKAAKKTTGKYEDVFDNGAMPTKKILPQYDDPVEDEGVTFDESGRLGDVEKKLGDLHKRPEGVSSTSRLESLVTSVKTSSDYYTQEEMLRFNKPPKKQKSLRKRDKLDLDALEAEAISAGLGAGDHGSRKDGKLQSGKDEQLRSEAQKRSDAYKSAIVRAEEACKALRHEQVSVFPVNEDENLVFGDEEDDLYKSIEKARKQALRKQNVATGAQAIASAITASNNSVENQTREAEVAQDDKVVFNETEEFVWGLQFDEKAHKQEGEDVFMMEEDEIPKSSDQEKIELHTSGLVETKHSNEDERLVNEDKEEIVPAPIFHEAAVGKGLSGVLQFLKGRGELEETEELGGRNTDKKKNKNLGIGSTSEPKEIQIDRRDEFGRIMTPKQAFRVLSHDFHGIRPGKGKREKFIKKHADEMKLKQKQIS